MKRRSFLGLLAAAVAAPAVKASAETKPSPLYLGEPRIVEWEGGVYVIRDVWSQPNYRGFIRCEYKVSREHGDAWVPCIEGVRYADIEPYCSAKAWHVMSIFTPTPRLLARIAA